MKLQVFRLGLSDYLSPDFSAKEASFLENSHPDIKLITSLEERTPSAPLALITNSQTQVEKYDQLFAEAAFAIHPNSGFDNFPYQFVKRVKTPILLGNEIRSHAVTLTALSTWLAPMQPAGDSKWNRNWQRDLFNNEILILGAGAVGQNIFNALKALGHSPHIYDPYSNLNELPTRKWDTIFMACSLTTSSYHFINKDFLESCSENLFLINTARGECVNTKDLLSFFNNSPKAKAYLDVWEGEPENFDSLSSHPQILLSSHKAGVFNQLEDYMLAFESRIIEIYLSGDYLFESISSLNLQHKDPELFYKHQADFLSSSAGRLGKSGNSGGNSSARCDTISGSF